MITKGLRLPILVYIVLNLAGMYYAFEMARLRLPLLAVLGTAVGYLVGCIFVVIVRDSIRHAKTYTAVKMTAPALSSF